MSNGQSTGRVMKAGLVISLLLIVARIPLELAGMPNAVNNIFGVAWLYFIMPVLFALAIAKSGEAKPMKALLKNVILFAVYTRIMVMITYICAYFFKWTAPRFSASQGGNVGENVSMLQGVMVIPVRNALIWVVMATIVGAIIGGITLKLTRKSVPSTAA